jgi:hypothetical protein
VEPGGNPNIWGLVTGTVASGFPKVIGGPLLAELVRVNVCRLKLPSFTLPKFFDFGLTVRRSGTGVGVGVGVGVVGVDVGVAGVDVGVAGVDVGVAGVGVGVAGVGVGVAGVGVGVAGVGVGVAMLFETLPRLAGTPLIAIEF